MSYWNRSYSPPPKPTVVENHGHCPFCFNAIAEQNWEPTEGMQDENGTPLRPSVSTCLNVRICCQCEQQLVRVPETQWRGPLKRKPTQGYRDYKKYLAGKKSYPLRYVRDTKEVVS